MALPAGYELRAPTSNDVDTVAAVVIADELDGGGQVVLAGPSCRGNGGPVAELTTDAWVVVDVTLEEPEIAQSWGVMVESSEPDRSPEGIVIGGIETDEDLPAIHALLHEAFIDDRSRHHPAPFERWIEEETSTPTYDPTLWLLARDRGEPVGVLTASIHGSSRLGELPRGLGFTSGTRDRSGTPPSLVRHVADRDIRSGACS